MKTLLAWIRNHACGLMLFGSLALMLISMLVSLVIRSVVPICFVFAAISAVGAILFAFSLGESLDPFVLEGRLGEWMFCLLFIAPFIMTWIVTTYSFMIEGGLGALAQYQFEWLSPPWYYERQTLGQLLAPGLYAGLFTLVVSIVGGVYYTIKSVCHQRSVTA